MHPTGGSLRVFKQFLWLAVGSVKVASSRPTHQRVTQTVGRSLGGVVHGQAVGMEGVAGLPGPSGQALLGAALPNIPYTDRGGSGPVDGVGAPAADGWRWAALLRGRP